jgi:hypothetical protein
MRRYDDPVDVRRGQVAGPGGSGRTVELLEGPEQFLWKGRLWKVSAVLAHWVEAGAWWQSSGVQAVLGGDDPGAGGATGSDLSAEREVWRVEADRGMASAPRSGAGTGAGTGPSTRVGVFDLVFDWADGSWRLTRCLD